jgi:hypothetical protein
MKHTVWRDTVDLSQSRKEPFGDTFRYKDTASLPQDRLLLVDLFQPFLSSDI